MLGLLGVGRVGEVPGLLNGDLERTRERLAQVGLDILGNACTNRGTPLVGERVRGEG